VGWADVILDGSGHFIDGIRQRDQRPVSDCPVLNPATVQVTQLPVSRATDIDRAVAAAVSAQRAWAADPPTREDVLVCVATAITDHIDELAYLESLDTRTPAANASAEVEASGQTFRYYAGYATKLYGEHVPRCPTTKECAASPDPAPSSWSRSRRHRRQARQPVPVPFSPTRSSCLTLLSWIRISQSQYRRALLRALELTRLRRRLGHTCHRYVIPLAMRSLYRPLPTSAHRPPRWPQHTSTHRHGVRQFDDVQP
jgi:hypothetical protein